MLNIFHPGDFYYYIINIASVEMEYVNDKVLDIIGISPKDFTVESKRYIRTTKTDLWHTNKK